MWNGHIATHARQMERDIVRQLSGSTKEEQIATLKELIWILNETVKRWEEL